MKETMVTRTIVTTIVTALCVNVEEKTTFEKEIILPRTYKDQKSLNKALAKVSTDVEKVVSVISTTTKETLYGMSEVDFIANAKVLPPRKVSK